MMQNMIMDYFAMIGMNLLMKRGRKTWQLFLLSFLFSGLDTIVVLLFSNVLYVFFFVRTCLNFFMLLVICGKMRWTDWGECLLIQFFCNTMLGGIMEWLNEIQMLAGNFFLYAIVTLIIVTGILSYLERRNQYRIHMMPVRLTHCGKMMEATAYWDSGNQLTDLYTGKPVNIVSKSLAKKLCEETLPAIRYVPFQSLGQKEGMILVFTIDVMEVLGKNDVLKIQSAVLGIAEDSLFEKKDYNIILHASIRAK